VGYRWGITNGNINISLLTQWLWLEWKSWLGTGTTTFYNGYRCKFSFLIFSYFRPANINLFFNISKHDFAYYSLKPIKYPFHILQITSTKKKKFKEYFFHIFQVSDSPRVFRFPPLIKLTPQYKWNIVESGIKHHNPNHYSYFLKEQIVSLIYKFSEGFCLFLYLCECFFNHTGKKGAFCNYIQSGVFFF
jgi:hypothetical protein